MEAQNRPVMVKQACPRQSGAADLLSQYVIWTIWKAQATYSAVCMFSHRQGMPVPLPQHRQQIGDACCCGSH